MSNCIVVAIDGPAGAGKSTVAKLVAERLSYLYIDTGAMYRAVAYRIMKDGVQVSDPAKVTRAAKKLDIRLKDTENGQRVYVDGEDVTEAIRSVEVTRLSSPVSAVPGVRKRLVDLQRNMAEDEAGVVMEGRDIGTVVFPNAKVKVYLTASVEERARRRTLEMTRKGMQADVKQVETEIRERDLRDSTRSTAPLAQASDAVMVNTDGVSIEQVVDKIAAIHDLRVIA